MDSERENQIDIKILGKSQSSSTDTVILDLKTRRTLDDRETHDERHRELIGAIFQANELRETPFSET